MRLGVGQVVGDYRVERALGKGGTSVVYLVRDVHHGALHALKVLSVTSPVIRVRMQREGRVQAQLQHPNVVAVHEVLELDGSPALLMEYVDGTPLDAALKRYRLTQSDAELLFNGIVQGVQAAHAAGLVHRDLKPANVLLARTSQGFVPKVADFGLAKLLSPDPGAAHTRAGVSMGTPSYMSPEQVRDAGSVDQRADVWSLGCILYELVTRHRAFPGKQALAIYNAVVRGRFSSPREHAPDLPDRILNAIEGALHIDPDTRIPDCAALQAVLAGEERWEPPLLEVEADLPSDLGSVGGWSHLSQGDLWTEEPTAGDDAPWMPLAGSATDHPAPAYLADDPPAVAGGPPPEHSLPHALGQEAFGRAVGDPAEVSADDLVPLGVEPAPREPGTLAPGLSLPSLSAPIGGPAPSRRAAWLIGLALLIGVPSLVAAGMVGGALLAAPSAVPVGADAPVPQVDASSPAPAEPAGRSEPNVRPVPDPVPVVRSASRPEVAPVVATPAVVSAPVAPRAVPVVPEPPATHDVVLNSLPFGARMSSGGQQGRAPWRVNLAEGDHAVEVTNGRQSGSFELSVQAEGPRAFCYHLADQELRTGPCSLGSP